MSISTEFDGAELAAALDELEAKPNRITLAQFARLSQAYRTPRKEQPRNKKNIDPEVAALTQLFVGMIDLYKETQVYISLSDERPVLRLPPVFSQLNTLPQTHETNEARIVNMKMSGSPIATHGYEAFDNFFGLFVKSQLTDDVLNRIVQNTHVTREIVDEVKRIYGHGGSVSDKPTAVEDSTNPSDDFF